MKIQILSIDGEKKSETNTALFDTKIREDIIQKVVEAEKTKQPYAPFYLAGKQASASGNIRHGRRKWKTAYGKGISRVPRKLFWRRGTQFHWQAATIASARGGRRAHPPKILSMLNEKKINKKERKFAFFSALALVASVDKLKKKYKTLTNKELKLKLPIVVESKILELKTKDFFKSLKNILQDLALIEIAIQKRAVRAGKGKMRGRKYKKTAGLLFVVGNKENKKIQGIELKKVAQLSISDLASNGARLTIFTEEAIKDIENKLFKRAFFKKEASGRKQRDLGENERKNKFFGEKTEKIKEENKKIKMEKK